MLIEIPINEIPFFNKKDGEKDNQQTCRIPLLKTQQKISPFDVISSNYYLEIIVYISYFINISEFPILISLPKGISLSELPFLPIVQGVSNIFDYQRALVYNSEVDKIQVKSLLPETIKVVENLNYLNKIDPFIQKLFSKPKPRSNDLNTVCAYKITKEFKNTQTYILSNLQKYLLWECIRNNDIFALPIGPLSLQELEGNDFKELIQLFETTYVIGSGNPWYASYLIVSKIDHNFLNSCIEL